jgi:uncharacterized surface protein with fasciclin (FAS1) repeats
MSDASEPLFDLLPEPELIEAMGADIATAEKVAVLARLQQRVEKNRASLQKHARNFNEMYDEAVRRLPVEGLIQLAERIQEAEKGAAEQLDPWVHALHQALLVPSQEGRQYVQELMEISAAWLAVYQDTRSRLLELASERRAASREVLRARPVEGDIDFAELSREHIARYPKIRAALAK